MDKELLETLNKVKDTLKDYVDKNEKKFVKELNNEFKKAHKEECKISIEKDKKGQACVRTEGSTLAILITLAGLEKSVLESTHVPAGVWEMVKNHVGTKGAK